MSGFANTVFTLLVGWFQAVVSLIWSGLTDKNGGNLFTWIGNHWIVIVLVLCAVGSVIDVSVYIARWKPFDVVRSYFERKRGRSSAVLSSRIPETEEAYSDSPENNDQISSPNGYRPLFSSNQPSRVSTRDGYSEYADDRISVSSVPDTSRPDLPETRYTAEKRYPADDSPYRRPVPEPVMSGQNERSEKHETGRIQDSAVRPRRRRINVSELFGNPEEDMIHFTPPKPVIDQAKAYHSPVYPRNWKENGDSSNESGAR